jgi:hypothetical protein
MSNIEQLENHLMLAYNAAVRMANEEYPDSDPNGVGRALRSYTIPNLRLYVEGTQGGSVRHLKELIESGTKDA